ncbi:MAG: UPF0280 family protein [Deltaproteobacteria bacterium]|nr:UPF0280 family protein [Deltaproteobacteria bacterium]
MSSYEKRFYRTRTASAEWASFTVAVKESDLWIRARRDLSSAGYEALYNVRYPVETYIQQHPEFQEALVPLPPDPLAPALIREMLAAGRQAGVGPMAAVAGAIAEGVGRALQPWSPEIIVENGGDLFLASREPLTVGLYAGKSPLSHRIGVALPPRPEGAGLCTSSGTVGHSLSFGQADAVTVLSVSAALSDAAATAVGNLVRTGKDIPAALDRAQEIAGIEGVLIVIGDQLGIWGQLAIVPL